MELTLQIKDQTKATWLVNLLNELDFVQVTSEMIVAKSERKNVNIIEDRGDDEAYDFSDEPPDFFALAGIWKDRDITIESIRKSAWPRQYK